MNKQIIGELQGKLEKIQKEEELERKEFLEKVQDIRGKEIETKIPQEPPKITPASFPKKNSSFEKVGARIIVSIITFAIIIALFIFWHWYLGNILGLNNNE